MRSKILKAVSTRLKTLIKYVMKAPNINALPRWLFVGIVRARILNLSGRINLDGQFWKNFKLQIGNETHQQVILDLTSHSSLDVLEEVVVNSIYTIENLPFTPEIIVDCGANIGYFTSICRVRYPKAKIYCWEPEPNNYLNLRAQPLIKNSDNVECYECAVAVFNGTVNFSGAGSGGRIINSDYRADRLVSTIDFPFWMKENCRDYALIKIDIEGYEAQLLPALQGLWPTNCALFLETHEKFGKDHAIISLLNHIGFSVALLHKCRRLVADLEGMVEFFCHEKSRQIRLPNPQLA